MSVSPMFKRLSELEIKMEDSAVVENCDALENLDRSYDEVWSDILNYSPQNNDLAELMLLLLLDKMADKSARGESVVQIREKIFDLFQTAHERAMPNEKAKTNFHANAGLV